jgi:hypothetical protein
MLFLNSCKDKENTGAKERLMKLERFLETDPAKVSDNLKNFNLRRLSNNNRSYYGLLKTISDDKLYVDFTSDSLINSVVNYYRYHNEGTENHIRSLIYQSIVRQRMNFTDSTVIVPLKEAEKYFVTQETKNPATGYLMNYYLGDIHVENNNNEIAGTYYQKALCFAKEENNIRHHFDAYIALFWNEMVQDNFTAGKIYLDTLRAFENLGPDTEYSLFNALSAYYDTQHEYDKALDIKKKQIALIPYVKQKADLFRVYYAISIRYANLNLLDSALYYGHLAIENIQDSIYPLNYLLYENIADIAGKQEDYKMSAQYLKKSSRVREASIERDLDAHVLELEKKYALVEAENKALIAQRHSRLSATAGIVLLFILILLYIYFSKQNTFHKLQKRQLEAEKREAEIRGQIAEMEINFMNKQSETKDQILAVYATFIKQYADLFQSFRTLATKTRGKNPALADEYDSLLKQGQHQFSTLTAELFTAEKLSQLLRLTNSPDYLNYNDRLILFMLACKVENSQIAALLNTTPTSFKARKTQLKKKIAQKTDHLPDAEKLSGFFY